jgi:hypothetical protein
VIGHACTSAAPLVPGLLNQGYSVSVERGRLVVIQSDGTLMSKKWTNSHQPKLIAEILTQTGREALIYISSSVGKYVGNHAGGVTLQFEHAVTRAEAYAIFNANLHRSRNTKHGKAGTSLPKGQFHVTKGSGFCKLWASMGLPPKRLSSYYEYMGNLKLLFFESQDTYTSESRLNSSALRPLHISFHEVQEAFGLTDSTPTTDRQCADKRPTVATDKETLQPSETLGLQTDSTTGENYYGKTVIRKKVTRDNVYSINTIDKENSNAAYCDSKSLPEITKRPEDQTDDEWDADFDEAYSLEHGYYL